MVPGPSDPTQHRNTESPEPSLDTRGAAVRGSALALWAITLFWLVKMAVPGLAEAIQPVDDWFWELAVATEQAALVAVAKTLHVVGGFVPMLVLVVIVAVVLAWL